MRDILLIARREYLEQVRGKAFRVTTVLIPVVFTCLMGVITMASRHTGVGKHLAIASNDPALAASVRETILADKDAQATVDVVAPVAASDRKALLDRVDAREFDDLVWVSMPANGEAEATLYARSSGDFATADRVKTAVNRAVVERRLASRGIASADVAMLTKTVDVKTMQVRNGQETASSAREALGGAYAMAFLLSFTVVMYGMNVGRSVIQEKTSRIFEVMLSMVKPGDMLAGKLLGIGAVGLTQLVIWCVAGALFAGSAMAEKLMDGGIKLDVSPLALVLFAVYFVLGYALYSALFAGLAATCDTEQELQQYAPLAAVPIWLSFGMIAFIVSNPNSIWSVAISMFPPCAPIIMFLRIASQFPPIWQIALSLGLMVITVWAVVWIASRIYRVGILMYGKRATLPEILRWLRYS